MRTVSVWFGRKDLLWPYNVQYCNCYLFVRRTDVPHLKILSVEHLTSTGHHHDDDDTTSEVVYSIICVPATLRRWMVPVTRRSFGSTDVGKRPDWFVLHLGLVDNAGASVRLCSIHQRQVPIPNGAARRCGRVDQTRQDTSG